MNLNPLNHPICFAQPLRLVHTSSWIEHIPFSMYLIDILRPKVFIELGTHMGVSYSAFCQAVKQLGINTLCYAIDTWEGDFQSFFYGPEVLADLRAHHDPLYSGFSRLVQSTFDDAVKYFSDGSIDLLHIDGLHTYEAVKHDFETWLPKMSKQGVILFHDINVRERDFGVWQLWEELSAIYPSFSFIHGHGLGLLAVSTEYPDTLETLLKMSDEEMIQFREFFFQISRRLVTQIEKEQKIQEYIAWIAKQDQSINELTSRAAEREQAVQALTAHAAERGQAVNVLSTQLAEKERAMQTLYSQMSEQVAERDRALQSLSTQHSNLEQELIRKNEHMEEREQILHSLNSKLLEIYGSTAWKIMQYLWRIRIFLAPVSSSRERLGKSFVGMLKGKPKKLPSPSSREDESYYIDLIQSSGLFDRDFYSDRYPDIARSNVDPLLHYLRTGGFEGRDPGPSFSSSFYMSYYEDVKGTGLNPLVHFLKFGKQEGRTVQSEQTIQSLTPQVKEARLQASRIESPYKKAYEGMIALYQSKVSEEYVPDIESNIEIIEPAVKLLAFYLPQFHPIPENDQWWGKGFTEWTNVTKAVPQFVGHYQPHLPGELGFYDLRIPEVQVSQVELSRKYGIYGFCFHYYWFNGKRLLEKPLEQFIANPDIDYPFCICWANENWTRRWDGLENDILIAQIHSTQNDLSFIEDVGKYFLNKNYIHIDGRPLLVVYRADLLPNPFETTRIWKEYCEKAGRGKPYLVAAQTFTFANIGDPREIGFDAAVEFPPHCNPAYEVRDITNSLDLINLRFEGKVYDYKDLIRSFYHNARSATFPLFKTVSPGWDNEPRKPGKGDAFAFSSPKLYQTWLEDACQHAMAQKWSKENFVFINAWNEWAESAYLEPDRKYGYAYLQATYDVLRSFSSNKKYNTISILKSSKITKKHETAVILHLYYPELWEEIKGYLDNLEENYDLYVSIPTDVEFDTKIISQNHSSSYFYHFLNRGRDIAPFLQLLPTITSLEYQYVLKIHTKKSMHRGDGLEWRQDMIIKLIGSKKNISIAKDAFRNEDIGMVAPAIHLLPIKYFWGSNKEIVDQLSEKLGIRNREFYFVSGSMYWFRPSAISLLEKLKYDMTSFEPEVGQTDGTLAHALERFIGLVVLEGGYDILEIDQFGEIITPSLSKLMERRHYPFAGATYA